MVMAVVTAHIFCPYSELGILLPVKIRVLSLSLLSTQIEYRMQSLDWIGKFIDKKYICLLIGLKRREVY